MQEMQKMQVWSLGQEDPLKEELATHSIILAWKIPWTEEPGRLQSMGSQSQTRLSWHTLSTARRPSLNWHSKPSWCVRGSPTVLASSSALAPVLSVQPASAPSPSFPSWALPPVSLANSHSSLSLSSQRALLWPVTSLTPTGWSSHLSLSWDSLHTPCRCHTACTCGFAYLSTQVLWVLGTKPCTIPS